jgi:hypothetical protein
LAGVNTRDRYQLCAGYGYTVLIARRPVRQLCALGIGVMRRRNDLLSTGRHW